MGRTTTAPTWPSDALGSTTTVTLPAAPRGGCCAHAARSASASRPITSRDVMDRPRRKLLSAKTIIQRPSLIAAPRNRNSGKESREQEIDRRRTPTDADRCAFPAICLSLAAQGAGVCSRRRAACCRADVFAAGVRDLIDAGPRPTQIGARSRLYASVLLRKALAFAAGAVLLAAGLMFSLLVFAF